jgi:hypothetical protein
LPRSSSEHVAAQRIPLGGPSRCACPRPGRARAWRDGRARVDRDLAPAAVLVRFRSSPDHVRGSLHEPRTPAGRGSSAPRSGTRRTSSRSSRRSRSPPGRSSPRSALGPRSFRPGFTMGAVGWPTGCVPTRARRPKRGRASPLRRWAPPLSPRPFPPGRSSSRRRPS